MNSKKVPAPLSYEELLDRYQHVNLTEEIFLNPTARKFELAKASNNINITRVVAVKRLKNIDPSHPAYAALCSLRRDTWSNAKLRNINLARAAAEYDNFIRQVFMFFLLDGSPELARRVPTAL
jgi:hypothetical protein